MICLACISLHTQFPQTQVERHYPQSSAVLGSVFKGRFLQPNVRLQVDAKETAV